MTTAAKAGRLVFALLALSPALGRATPAADAEAAPAVAVPPPPPKTLNLGVGLRVGGSLDSSTDPTKTSQVGLSTLDIRPYISGQVHPLLKFEGNLDLNNGDNSRIRVLDAVGKIEPSDLFNVWFGRFLPPSDRANLSGPYYQNAWIFLQKDLLGFNFDLLFEKKLAWADTLSLEGAYYNFNKGAQGWSWYALGSYLFATKVAFGYVQPMVRWQQQTPTAGGDPTRVLDGGLNYIVDGHNTRFAFVIENRNPPTAPSTTSYQLGFQ